ncbi:phosphoglycolate phosphatase [Halalkaliarchaeum desulfuricum]|uniref:Phosphoglycolate phosphatase n=1 Tax=Halalkaliarchaeum desulfuricum TaxID=2055893 RepID=A0A343THF3_9EURY|nr:HAD family hydrolase [Halalkaliarchaeum desulfuricum]AUX08525.1 phosphoglycolate phosphatase [Halalkaliarchaeum desulfuricum]
MAIDSYDVWLFDLDGTVVDVEWSYTRELFDRVGDRIGREFTDREALVLWHGLGGDRNGQLREWGLEPTGFWETFHDEENPLERADATYLHPDAERLIREIHGPIGLVTHSQEFLASPVLDRLDIRDWFDVVVCCTDELGWKPDPAPVWYALESMGAADADRVVLAGDSSSDVGAAWNAGHDAVHVERHGHESRGRCVLADYMVQSFDEFPRVPLADADLSFLQTSEEPTSIDRTRTRASD